MTVISAQTGAADEASLIRGALPPTIYTADDTLEVVLEFSRAVDVDTSGGTSDIGLTIGNSSVRAAYASGSGSRALVFSYTVSDGDAGGVSVAANSLRLNGGRISSTGRTEEAELEHALTTLNSVSVGVP